MIKYIKVFSVLFFLICVNSFAQKSQGIGTNTPNPRAVLDISVENPSTYPQGLLLPRLTTAQRTSLGTVAGLAIGISVYDTDDKNFYTWDGTTWKSTGSILNTIVGVNGILVNNSGGNFSVTGQWISSSSDKIYTNSFIGIGGINTGTSLLEVFGQITANAGYRTGVGLVNGGNQAGFDFVGTNEISLRTGGLSRLNINNTGIASFMGSNFILDGGLRIRNLSITGAVLTVDNLGNLGMGTLSSSPSPWINQSSNQIYTNSFVGIGSLLANNNSALYISKSGTSGSSANNGVDLLIDQQGTFGATGYNVNSGGSGTNPITGFSATFTNTPSAANKTGIYVNIQQISGSAGIHYGANLNVSGVGTVGGQIYGTNAIVRNGLNAYGGYFDVANASNNYGVYSKVIGSSTNNNYGVYVESGSVGLTAYGIYVTSTSGNTGNYIAGAFLGGNVGIGTSAPSTALHVSGGARITNLSVSGSVITVDGSGNLGMGTMAAGNVSGTGTIGNVPFWNGANSLGNDNNFFWDNTNKRLGIGTNSPGSLLDVVDPSSYTVYFRSAGGTLRFIGLGSVNYIQSGINPGGGSTADLAFSDMNNANQWMVIKASSGNVGIATNTPNQKLTVLGNSSVTGIGYFGTIAGLALNGATAGSVVTVDGTGRLGFGSLSFSQNQWISSSSSQIYTNSLVGIGTTAPGTSFQVAGASNPAVITAYNAATTSGVQGGILNMRSNSSSIYTPVALAFNQSLGVFGFAGFNGTDFGSNGPSADIRAMSTQAFSLAATGTKLVFSTTPNGSNSSIERLTIDHTGNIGIGIATPTNQLHVVAPVNTSIVGMFEGNTSSSNPVNIRVKNTGSAGSALALEYAAGNLFAMSSNSLNQFALYSSVSNKEFVNYAPTTERFQISNSSGSVVINASATGIGVQTFTGNEALRIGGLNPTSPKGLVFPYVTTAQMVVLTSQLGALDAGMAFFNTDNKNVAIWDGTKWQGEGNSGGGSGSTSNDQYNWNVGGNTVSGFSFVTMTGYGKLGSNDNMNVAIVTNNQPRILVNTTGGVGIGFASNVMKSTLQVNGDVGLGDGLVTGNKPVVVWLTNTGTIAGTANAIVSVGSTDDSFKMSNVEDDNSVIGVLTEACPINSVCKIAISGIVSVQVSGTITRGQHCTASATQGAAKSVSIPNLGASIGVFLQTIGSGTARVLLR